MIINKKQKLKLEMHASDIRVQAKIYLVLNNTTALPVLKILTQNYCHV